VSQITHVSPDQYLAAVVHDGDGADTELYNNPASRGSGETHPYVMGFSHSPSPCWPDCPRGTIFDLNFSKFFESIFG